MNGAFSSHGIDLLDGESSGGRLQRELCISLGLKGDNAPDHLDWDDVYRALDAAAQIPLSLEEQDIVDSWDRLIETLQLPPISSATKIELREKGGLGEGRFRIITVLRIDGSTIETTKRIGGIVKNHSGDQYLLPSTVYRLMEIVESPVPPPKPWVERLAWWAQVRTLAENAGAELSRYLQSEEIVAAKSVGLAVSVEQPGCYRLDPDVPGVDPNELGNALRRTPVVDKPSHRLQREDGSRQTILTTKRSGKAYRAVKKLDRVDDETLALLKISPEEVLGTDAFDLEDFGPRVKGIGPPVYRAIPFISQMEGTGGWFDWDAGVALSESGGSERPRISFRSEKDAQKFLAAWTMAKKSGKKTLEFQGKRIPVSDVDPKAIMEAIKKTKQILKDPGSGVKKDVLQIWDNIDNLEFNLGEGDSFDLGHLDWNRPPKMAAHISLKSYQVDGFRWLVRAAIEERGALIADEMGLGKTVQVLALLSALKEIDGGKPVLIVTPASLLENWAEEADKFFPDRFRGIKVFRGGKVGLGDPNVDILITSYETLQRRQFEFGRISWSVLIFDEAQKAKNPKTRISSALKAMQAKVRVAVTGTPVENSLIEMWNILDTVRPGCLKSLKEFSTKYVRGLPPVGSDSREQLSKELQESVSRIFLRRERSEFLSDELPATKEHLLPVRMNALMKRRYEDLLDQARDAGRGEILALIGRLLAVCSDPRLHPMGSLDEEDEISPKLQVLLDILEKRVRPNGEKAIVFTRLLDLQQIIRRALSTRFGIDAPILNGSTPGRKRLGLVDDFNGFAGFDVMILGPRAGGVGLNIVGANHVVHFTREWNPAIEAQATARVHRIGQMLPVHVYLPIVQGPEPGIFSAEERLHNLLTEKSRLASDFLSPIADATLNPEDFMKGFVVGGPAVIDQEIDIDSLGPRDLEFLVGVLLEKEGWESEVTREKHDHGVDVVAVRGNVRIVVQVKHSKVVSADAVGEIVTGERMYPTDRRQSEKWLFVTGRVTGEAHARAEANNVRVVERNLLLDRLSSAGVSLEDLRRRRNSGM